MTWSPAGRRRQSVTVKVNRVVLPFLPSALLTSLMLMRADHAGLAFKIAGTQVGCRPAYGAGPDEVAAAIQLANVHVSAACRGQVERARSGVGIERAAERTAL